MDPAQAVEPPVADAAPAADPVDAPASALDGLARAFIALAGLCLLAGIGMVYVGLDREMPERAAVEAEVRARLALPDGALAPAQQAQLDNEVHRAQWIVQKRGQLMLRLGCITVFGSLVPTLAGILLLKQRWLPVPLAFSLGLALLLPAGAWGAVETLVPAADPESALASSTQPSTGDGVPNLVVSGALVALGGLGTWGSLTLVSHMKTD